MQVGAIFINREIVSVVQGFHGGHRLGDVGSEDGIHVMEGYLQKRIGYRGYD